MEAFNWSILIGGLAFFFLGLDRARLGLKKTGGDRLRLIMSRMTDNRFVAICIGAFITLTLQSSSATTVILVSFAETQLITLTQAISLTLGADIGTTIVVILLSVKNITEYSILIIAIGVFLQLTSKRKKLKYVSFIVLGFGLIFFGMHMMSEAAYPLKNDEMARELFAFLAAHPAWSLLFATIFTAIVQTSAATIGMAIALSFAGVLTFDSAIPIVLGANVGTCITAGLASISSETNGRRVALGHVLIKIFAVAIVFPFIGQYAEFIDSVAAHLLVFTPTFAASISGKIALAHLFFNLFLAILFAPFVKPICLLIEKIIPSKIDKDEEFKPRYLDEKLLGTPIIAFAQAKREILRIANWTSELFASSLGMFHRSANIEEESERIGSLDDKIDILEQAVRFYLIKIAQESLTEEEVVSELALLTIAGELENIGDIVSKELLALAEKKAKKKQIFSDEGWHELRRFHKLVLDNFNLTIALLTHPHDDIALKVIRHEEQIDMVEQELRQSHFKRLHNGLSESFETSSIHLDILGNMRVINDKITKIAKTARI